MLEVSISHELPRWLYMLLQLLPAITVTSAALLVNDTARQIRGAETDRHKRMEVSGYVRTEHANRRD